MIIVIRSSPWLRYYIAVFKIAWSVCIPFISIAFLIVASLQSCSHSVVSGTTVVTETGAAERDSVLVMPADSSPVFRGLRNHDLVIRFYDQRNHRPAWSQTGRWPPVADSLLILIDRVSYFGLRTSDYCSEELLQHPDHRLHTTRIDALLTDALISIARDIARAGYSDSALLATTEQVARDGSVAHALVSIEPAWVEYRLLRHQLRVLLDSLAQDSSAVDGLREDRISAVGRSLAKWRRETAEPPPWYIYVNIPSFMLRVMEGDSVMFESRIIVGNARTPTPELSSKVERLVTYPYWHVPSKITRSEYLPQIQRDRSFLIRNNFELLDRKGNVVHPDSLEWSLFSRDYFPYALRQREGGENALGLIKFLFDNPYAVFLHDTNAQGLFRSEMRALSHGCIRVERAEALAHYLLTGRTTAKSPELRRHLRERSRHYLDLPRPVPLFIRYFTAEAFPDALHVYPDIYSRKEFFGAAGKNHFPD